MEAVGVTGIGRQSLLAADLGVEIPSRPHMAKASLMEGRRYASARIDRVYLKIWDGCLAIAVIHWHILKSGQRVDRR
jgi:hypothetical protein